MKGSRYYDDKKGLRHVRRRDDRILRKKDDIRRYGGGPRTEMDDASLSQPLSDQPRVEAREIGTLYREA